jgi:hypothetical protein
MEYNANNSFTYSIDRYKKILKELSYVLGRNVISLSIEQNNKWNNELWFKYLDADSTWNNY